MLVFSFTSKQTALMRRRSEAAGNSRKLGPRIRSCPHPASSPPQFFRWELLLRETRDVHQDAGANPDIDKSERWPCPGASWYFHEGLLGANPIFRTCPANSREDAFGLDAISVLLNGVHT